MSSRRHARFRGSQAATGRTAGTLAGVAVVLVVVLASLVSAVACPPETSGAAAPAAPSGFYRPPRPLPLGPPGEVVRSAALAVGDLLPAGTTAYRVLYLSTSVMGRGVAVSGMVVVPGGKPPSGGFPIVSWAHATAGLGDQCAPSLTGVGSIPAVGDLIAHRLIVVATDYQGLGTPGTPSYLVGQSEAEDVLDAARAARNLVGGAASNVVAVLGFSQGGQAALFTSQIASSYAPELFVAGAVAVSPVTSLAELIPAHPSADADSGGVYAVMALDAWDHVYANLDLSDVLARWSAGRARTVSTGCTDTLAPTYDSVAGRDVFRSGWQQAGGLVGDITGNDPGRVGTSTPLLIVEGSDDTLTPTATVAAFVAGQLCRSDHDSVQYLQVGGAGHGDVLQATLQGIVGWITRRLSGSPVKDTCRRPVRATGRAG